MPPKQNSQSNAHYYEFVEPNVNWDFPSELREPPFSYHWEAYPAFITRLVREASVPRPTSAGAGPSTRSTTNALPQPSIPLEQVVAALAAAFRAGQKSNEYKFQEFQNKMDDIYDDIKFARETHQEMLKLKKSCKEHYQCHENLANGVIALGERVNTLEEKGTTDAAAREEAQQNQVATNAQLEAAIQSIEALNLAMEQTQEQIGLMAVELQEFGAGPEQEIEEVEPMEPEVADEEPEVIDP